MGAIDNCCICFRPVGETICEVVDGETGKTKFVTVDLHLSSTGIAHKVHRVCIYEWFQEQLDKESIGRNPNDTNNIPFTCPLCRERISLIEAENATGVLLADYIAEIRNMRLEEQKDSSCVVM